MSRRIAKILDESEHIITKLLSQLEEKNGWPSHDARFLAENTQKVRSKIAELGLDPDDTTAPELFHALQVKFSKTSRLFDLHFAAQDMNFDQKCAKAVQLVENNFELPNLWALKNGVTKSLLRQMPPKHTMKHLGYRSIESMLKREKSKEIMLAAHYLESITWQKDMQRFISKVNHADFELRKTSIIVLESKKWSDVDGPADFIATNYDVGTVAIWPATELKSASLLNLVLMLGRELSSSGEYALSGVLDWWKDTDHLIAEFGDEHISLNLRDIGFSNLVDLSYTDRDSEIGRHSFWRELLSRYQHQLPSQDQFDHLARTNIQKARINIPEPAMEFVEDFDG